MAKKPDQSRVKKVFGEGPSSLQRDECGDAEAERQDRDQWHRWLREQRPPHYDQ